MKTTKKIIAVVLSVMLLLSVMPMAVFAATTTTVSTVTEFETAVANASAGDTIKLGANIDFTTDSKYAANSYSVEETYVNITGLTIDLDGNTITNNTAGLKFSGSNCVIKNGKIIGVADTYTRRYGLALWNYDAYVQGEADSERKHPSVGKTVLGVCVVAAFAVLSFLLRADYTFFAVFAVFLFYVFRKRHPLIRAGVGVAFLSITRTIGYYCATGFSFIPLAMYNGKKGKGLKWMFYLFYPGHLLLLAAIKHILFG